MKKFKLIVFIILIFFLIITFLYGIFGSQFSFLSIEEIKQNRELKKDLIDSLKINNTDTILDNTTNTFYYSVSENKDNKLLVLKLELKNNLKYKIVNEKFNIIKVNFLESIDIIIYNDKYYYETKIQLTNLPLININTPIDITTNDTESTFYYINQDNVNVSGYTKIHIRGYSSRSLPKKSYKIEFYNKKYTEEKNVVIPNFYNGNAFILDAVYRDPSKIRNVISTELWNDMSNDFTNVDIYSEFVELFINNEYVGLYVLTEPINRKKLNLNKSSTNDTGIVIKTNGWGTVGTNKDFENIENSTYLDYEIKYPNDEELFEGVWYNFLNKISNYYNPEVKTTDTVINNTFNLNNYLDIIIFNSFITNMDSCLTRNLYYYMYSLDDKTVYLQPWDLEFTYGHYLNESWFPLLEYDKIYCEFEQKDAPETNKLLIDRYWKLRKNILTKEYFSNLLDKYKNKLNKGSALRDSDEWYEYDVEKEIEEIRTWIYNRIEFFDEYVKELENE